MVAKITNVLLIYPRYTYPRKSPPIGLAYLAAYIRRGGFNPVIVDFNIDGCSEKELPRFLKEYTPLAVGISLMTNQYGEFLRLAELIKRCSSSIRIVAGGPHVSALPCETLKECPAIDFIVTGEGEATFIELLKAISDGEEDFANIRGLSFRLRGDIIQNQPRELIEDINSLPFPAWDLIDARKYSVFSIKKGLTFALLSSRGCPNHCIFCDSHTIFGRRFRPRSAENIFSEILSLHKMYGMNQFDFVDDMITLDKKRVLDLCVLLKESGISFTWMANARANTLDGEMLKAMKESGCVRIDIGVESGDPSVRRMAKKGITDEDVIRTHRLSKEAGIQVGSFVMVGNLGETMDSVRMTAGLLKDIGEDVMISIACPFPGTELYRIAKEKGYLRVTNWSHYVTSPTYLKNYHPVMVTDTMSQEGITKAYYYLYSIFAKKKFQTRYGKNFLLSPVFINDWLLNPTGDNGLFRKAAMFFNILKTHFMITKANEREL